MTRTSTSTSNPQGNCSSHSSDNEDTSPSISFPSSPFRSRAPTTEAESLTEVEEEVREEDPVVLMGYLIALICRIYQQLLELYNKVINHLQLQPWIDMVKQFCNQHPRLATAIGFMAFCIMLPLLPLLCFGFSVLLVAFLSLLVFEGTIISFLGLLLFGCLSGLVMMAVGLIGVVLVAYYVISQVYSDLTGHQLSLLELFKSARANYEQRRENANIASRHAATKKD